MLQRKIKIVYITPSLTTGGAERMLVDLLTGIDKNRFSVSLIIFGHEVVENIDWSNELQIAGISLHRTYVHKIQFLGKIGGIIRAVHIAWKIGKVLIIEKPDILHSQLFGDVYARVLGLLLRIPVLISTEQNINHAEPKILEIIKRLTGNRISSTVAISKAVQKDIIKKYDLKESLTTVIYNSVNIERFFKSIPETKLPSRNFVFGCVGRLSKQKGFDVLIKSMIEVNKKYPEARCRIVGEGEDRTELENLITASKLSDVMTLEGNIADIPKFLDEIDCFVMPSLWEGLGIAALEAGMRGVPIIASEVDGLAEIINQSRGTLVEVNNSQALAKAMINNIEEGYSKSIVEKSLRLQNYIKDNFSMESMITQYENLYLSLLDQVYARK